MEGYMILFVIMIIIGIIIIVSSIYNRQKNSTVAFDYLVLNRYFYGNYFMGNAIMFGLFYEVRK